MREAFNVAWSVYLMETPAVSRLPFSGVYAARLSFYAGWKSAYTHARDAGAVL